MERSFWLDGVVTSPPPVPTSAYATAPDQADDLFGVLFGAEDDDSELFATNEIVVLATYQNFIGGGGSVFIPGGGRGGGLSITNLIYGVDFGEGAAVEDPFQVQEIVVTAPQLDAREIVGRAAQSLALAIKTGTDASRWLLPRAEERRLDKLSETLDEVGDALRMQTIDLATAKTIMSTTLALVMDELGGAGMGALFAGLGAWASTVVPHPLLKLLGVPGFTAIGLALDFAISDAKGWEKLADLLTDGLFNGAKALSQAINDVMQAVHDGLSIWGSEYMPTYNDTFSFELESNGTYGDFDRDPSNGFEYGVAVYHEGLGESYGFTTNAVMPDYPGYGGDGGDPPGPVVWRDDDGVYI